MTLAGRQAIATAFLMGGDEDLREGVREAQDQGVEVVLLGIEAAGEENLSPTLTMEADDVIVLKKEFLAPYFRARSEPSPVSPRDSMSLHDVGKSFGLEVVQGRPSLDLDDLRKAKPKIPSDLDGELLRRARAAVGDRDLNEPERVELRRGFWGGVLEVPNETQLRS